MGAGGDDFTIYKIARPEKAHIYAVSSIPI
jgi:hypothetical protein